MHGATVSADGKLLIAGQQIEIPEYRLVSLIGDGASGIVSAGHHRFLDRPAAIKVWMKLRPNDSRDKFSQGIEEARKACTGGCKYAVAIYSAGETGGHFYCAMEQVKGPTLREFLSKTKSLMKRYALVELFLDAVYEMKRNNVVHGDLHQKNVLVVRDTIRIVDFGTSRVRGQVDFNARHWQVVHETYKAILSPFDIDEILYDEVAKDGSRYDPKNNPDRWYGYFIRGLPGLITTIWPNESEARFGVFKPVRDLNDRMKVVAEKLRKLVDFGDVEHFLANCDYDDKSPFWPLDLFELSGRKGHAPMLLIES